MESEEEISENADGAIQSSVGGRGGERRIVVEKIVHDIRSFEEANSNFNSGAISNLIHHEEARPLGNDSCRVLSSQLISPEKTMRCP